jgi:hypothetical protein
MRMNSSENLGPDASIQIPDEASKPENVQFGEIH